MTSLDARVKGGFLDAGMPPELVEELLIAFAEAKTRFYRGDLRPSAVEGGRFSEAVFRICEWAAFSKFTKIGVTLDTQKLINRLEPATAAPECIRIHIPRTLRVIYDIRNKRNAAHLADGIDPNMQDALLVVRNMEWVLAELMRLFHNVSAGEAHGIITDLVSKDVPLIQVFDGFPRVLKQLKASDHFLALLYWRGAEGATVEQLRSWARAPMRSQIIRTLSARKPAASFPRVIVTEARPRGQGVGLGAPSQEADNVGVQALLFAFGFQSQFSM